MSYHPSEIAETPDSTTIGPNGARAARQRRAASLYERMALAMDILGNLRSTLRAITTASGNTVDSANGVDSEELFSTWASLEAAVAGLESVASRARDHTDTLAAAVLGGRPDGENHDSYVTPGELEALIHAQRAALDGLNRQIDDAESALRQTETTSTQTSPSYGAVEIQDINEFLKDSPIASVPVNASYYQRILEAANSIDGDRRPMGAILREAGLITERQLENALKHQREGRKRPLGTLLVDLGYTTDTAIAQTIAAQLALPFVTLAQETVHQEALDTIPIHVARKHVCFPVRLNDGALYVAMANPLDLVALEDLRFASRKHVRPCVASREEITDHINRHYSGSFF